MDRAVKSTTHLPIQSQLVGKVNLIRPILSSQSEIPFCLWPLIRKYQTVTSCHRSKPDMESFVGMLSDSFLMALSLQKPRPSVGFSYLGWIITNINESPCTWKHTAHAFVAKHFEKVFFDGTLILKTFG